MQNLKELHLHDNKLTSLPSWLSNFKKLRVLEISGNCLTSVPDSIKNMKNIQNQLKN
jgi:Leucine-rich repeat (LRR) protein